MLHCIVRPARVIKDTPVRKDSASLHCDDVRPVLQIGSSSVFPIAQRHSQRYPNPMVHPQALMTGTTLGFENFLAGGSEIATASRALLPKDYENNDCDPAGVSDSNQALFECQGRFPVGVPVAYDQLAIIVNKKATWFPDSITFDQVKTLFQPKMGEATLLPNIFQGTDNIPNDIPLIFVPDAKSGTRDFFEEKTGLDFTSVLGYVDDAAIVEGVVNDDKLVGIGVVPLAFALRNQDRIRILSIDGIDPRDSSQVSTYALSRPLYKYYDAAPAADNFASLDYICALLSDEGQKLIEQALYIPLPSDEAQAARDKLLCRDRFGTQKAIDLQGVMADANTCRDVLRLVVIGSSTVYPITVEAARLYQSVFVVVDPRSTGSSIGIWDLIAGAVPIAGSSRQIRPSDFEEFDCKPEGIQVQDSAGQATAVSACQGVVPKGIIIGYDMLAVVVPADSPVTDLSSDDIKSIFVDKKSWSDVGVDLEGSPTLYVADVNSGTRAFFEEVVGAMDDKGYVNDNVIAKNVATNPTSIGFLGVAYAKTQPSLKTVTIDGISPVDNDPNYALARPLFYYYDLSGNDQSAKQVNDFLCWMLSDAGQKIVEGVNYIPLQGQFDEILAKGVEDLKCL